MGNRTAIEAFQRLLINKTISKLAQTKNSNFSF